MLRVLCHFVVVTCLSLTASAQGHRLEVVIRGLEDSTIYLAHHYGDLQLIKDTLILDPQGKGVFSGPEALPGGMYMIIFPRQKAYFEFILDQDQDFTLSTTEEDPVKNMVVKGSEDNEVFFDDLRFIQSQKDKYAALSEARQRIDSACKVHRTARCDSLDLLDEAMTNVGTEVQARRAKLMADHPGMLYTYVLKASENPVIPDSLEGDTSRTGQDRRYRYYKAHFFDNIDFSDDRILRTAIYHQKLKTFIETLVPQHPDSIIKDADYIIQKSKAHKELFKYTTAWILNKYAKNELVCMDKIYVHIADNYYLNGQADWVDNNQLIKIKQSADAQRPCVCGAIGQNITAMDLNGQMRSLYDIKADYTILMFVESDCGHCQKELPKVYNYWLSVRDKGVGAMVLATDELTDHWKKYMVEKGYTEWINVVDPEYKSGYKQKYNVNSTPIIYVLGKNKEVLGKRMSADALPGYLEFLMKNGDKM